MIDKLIQVGTTNPLILCLAASVILNSAILGAVLKFIPLLKSRDNNIDSLLKIIAAQAESSSSQTEVAAGFIERVLPVVLEGVQNDHERK